MFCAEDPNGGFDPTRLSLNAYDFSDFMRGYPAAKYVGIETKFTFITYDPRWPRDSGYNPRRDNPFHVLYNALADAAKSGKALAAGRNLMTTEWVPLISATNRDKAISAPTKLYFVQGAIFEHGGEVFAGGKKAPRGLGEDDLPQIIELSKTAGDDIATKLNQLAPNYTGETHLELQDEIFHYGDVTNLEHGAFVTVFNPDKHDVADPDAPAKGGSREFKSWSVMISRQFQYVAQRQPHTVSADISAYKNVIADRLVWWDDLIYVPKTEEICLWLAQAFVQMPDMLRYGWTDNPEFFSDEVNGVLANRLLVPAAGPSSGSGYSLPPGEDEVPTTTVSSAIPRDIGPVTADDEEVEEELSEEADEVFDEDKAEATVKEALEKNAPKLAAALDTAESVSVPRRKKIIRKVVRKGVKR